MFRTYYEGQLGIDLGYVDHGDSEQEIKVTLVVTVCQLRFNV